MDSADRDLEGALNVGDEERADFETNKALLFLAIGQPDVAYEVLRRVRTHSKRETTAAYSAVALARMGRIDEARATLDAANATQGESEELTAAREHLEFGGPGHFRPLSVSDDNGVGAVQRALYQLLQMNPSDQARVSGKTTVENHLTDEIRSAAASVTAIAPMLREVELNEDDTTAFFMRILDARGRLFGWSIPDQSRGGYSAKGNPGERDLVLRKDGYVVAVIEAVKCSSSPSTETAKRDLTSHFQKLLGYDQCQVFCLVVYSYVDQPSNVLSELHEIAKTDAPPAFTHSDSADLPHEDSRPIGFVATYRMQGGEEVKVVFLVMDMKQQRQRDAAALAGQTRGSR
jgi:hypothetical protein